MLQYLDNHYPHDTGAIQFSRPQFPYNSKCFQSLKWSLYILFVQKSLSEHSLSSNFIFSASAGQLAGSCGRKAFLGNPPTSTGSSISLTKKHPKCTFDSYPPLHDFILRKRTLSEHLNWQCWSGNSAKPSGCLLPNSLVVAIVAPIKKVWLWNGRTSPFWFTWLQAVQYELIIGHICHFPTISLDSDQPNSCRSPDGRSGDAEVLPHMEGLRHHLQ